MSEGLVGEARGARQQGGVLTDPWPDDDAGIPEGVLVEDRLQRLGTELANWQDAHAGP